MAAALLPPTMPELTSKNSLNYEQLSRAVGCTHIVELLGIFTGGLVYDKLRGHSDLVLGLMVLTAAVCTVCIPLVTNLAVIGLCFALFDMASGIINVSK